MFFFLGYVIVTLLGSVGGISLGFNEGTEVGFWYGKVLSRTLGAPVGP